MTGFLCNLKCCQLRVATPCIRSCRNPASWRCNRWDLRLLPSRCLRASPQCSGNKPGCFYFHPERQSLEMRVTPSHPTA